MVLFGRGTVMLGKKDEAQGSGGKVEPHAYVKQFDGQKTRNACLVPKKFGGDGESRRQLTNVEAWWRAKEIVGEQGGVGQDSFTDEMWGLVKHIFKNMMGISDKSEMLELRCVFLGGISELGLLPVTEAEELLADALEIRISGRFLRSF